MKAILAFCVIVLILAASFAPGSNILAPNSASSSLPPAQRTAVYAPAVATQSAGASLSDNANAQAVAQEQEAARVYAQAVQEEQTKRVIVATQQAALSAQAVNDVAVSKEYATLAAVSIQATSEAISRTIAWDAETYRANVAAIQATKEANIIQARDVADKGSTSKTVDMIWQVFPTLAALILFALLVLTLWKLIGRITPHIEEVEVEVPIIQSQTISPDPVVSKISGLNFTSADMRVLLTNIVIYSGRHIGWRQNRIAGSDEIGSAISDRAWSNAIRWGADNYQIVTQRGPIKNGGGTYAHCAMTELHNRLMLDPPKETVPDAPPTPT